MNKGITKRTLLKALPFAAAGLGIGTGTASRAQGPQAGKVLVAYFSRTGNTSVVAHQIRRARDATLYEITVTTPYPEDYQETVAQAKAETESSYLPPLGELVADISQCDTLYLGFPIWGMTAPPVIRSFLHAHDLAGKIVHPVITHGGYGLGNSLDIVRSHAPGADVREAFSMEADQERRTLEQVTGWLDG